MNAESESPVKHRLIVTFDQEPSADERDEVLSRVRDVIFHNFEPMSMDIEERAGSWILNVLMLVAPWVALQTAAYFYRKGLDRALAKGSELLSPAAATLQMAAASTTTTAIEQKVEVQAPIVQVNPAMRLVGMFDEFDDQLKSRRVRSLTLLGPVGEQVGVIHALRDPQEDLHVTAVLCNTEREAGDYLAQLQKSTR